MGYFDSLFFLFSSNKVCLTNFGRTLSELPRNSSIISKTRTILCRDPSFCCCQQSLCISRVVLATSPLFEFNFWNFQCQPFCNVQQMVKVWKIFSHTDCFSLTSLGVVQIFLVSLYLEIRILTSVASRRLFTFAEPEPAEEPDGLSLREGLSSWLIYILGWNCWLCW